MNAGDPAPRRLAALHDDCRAAICTATFCTATVRTAAVCTAVRTAVRTTVHRTITSTTALALCTGALSATSTIAEPT